MVHYRPFVLPGTAPIVPVCQPAIVVAVHSTGADLARLSAVLREFLPPVLATLCVFTPDGPRMHDAEEDERGAGGGTWHRADELAR